MRRDTRSRMRSVLTCISSSTPTYSECNYNFPEILKQQRNKLDSGTCVFPGGAVVACNEITNERVFMGFLLGVTWNCETSGWFCWDRRDYRNLAVAARVLITILSLLFPAQQQRVLIYLAVNTQTNNVSQSRCTKHQWLLSSLSPTASLPLVNMWLMDMSSEAVAIVMWENWYLGLQILLVGS